MGSSEFIGAVEEKVTGIDRFLETAIQLAEGMGWGDLKSAVDFISQLNKMRLLGTPSVLN